MTDVNKILEKVRKALSLARDNGNHEKESETAMLLAQRMLAKHNLSLSDVLEKQEMNTIVEGTHSTVQRVAWWLPIIHNVIADNFRCYCVAYKGNGQSRFVYIGRKDDVDVAIEVSRFAIECIKRYSRQYVAKNVSTNNTRLKNAIKNDYIRGYIQGLQDKFKEQVEQNDWGLVLVKDKEVVNYFQQLSTKSKPLKTRSTFTGDAMAMSQGYSDGKSFDYNRKAIE